MYNFREVLHDSRLILQLSMFGLGMGFANVCFIPSGTEPALGLAIFLVSAYAIAQACATKRFLRGFLLGLANCIWITGSHVLLAGTYLANHAKEAEMMKQMPIAASPQLLMPITGPIVGIVSGNVIGLLALLAGTMMKPKSVAAAA